MNLFFDMDGTLANFYGVPNWLECLMQEDATPYKVAERLAWTENLDRLLSLAQAQGHTVNILSWLSKSGSNEFMEEITLAKKEWLTINFPSVCWNSISCIAYGVRKADWKTQETDMLFDDELPNLEAWGNGAFHPSQMVKVLENLLF